MVREIRQKIGPPAWTGGFDCANNQTSAGASADTVWACWESSRGCRISAKG